MSALSARSRPESLCSTSDAGQDSAAVRRLIECRSDLMRFFRRRLNRPEDGEDAFQDFCLKVIRAADVPDDARVDAWLRRVMRNALTDHYRRRAVRRRAIAAYEAEPSEPVVQPAADQPEDPCHCVRDLVSTLRPDYAEIIRRAYLEEEPREQIAADLRLTINNVGVRLHRARRALKEAIEERCPTCCGDSFRTRDCRPVTHKACRVERSSSECNDAVAEASL